MKTSRRFGPGWRGFVFSVLGAASALLAPPRAVAQFCSNCIYNQSALQAGAQFHISSGTIDGKLTVGQLNISTISASTGTFGVVFASGQYITDLNASQLLLGTVPSAVVAGAYSGITGVGTLTAGVWHGTVLGTQYGGTGQNFVTAGAASLPYFSNTGIMTTLPSPSFLGVLESTGTGGPPVWVSSPALTGQNFTQIPLTALTGTAFPTSIIVSSNSIPYVDAATIHGNISGGAATLTVALPVANLAAGTLPTSNAASSVTATGVTAIVCGGPSTLCQLNVHTDGRIYSATQFNLIAYSTSIAPGALPAGVTIAAAQVTAGTLANNVIASSIATTGIGAGSFGGVARTLQLVIGTDGRISTVTVSNIALPLSQLNAGTLASNVLVPAVNVQAGSLGSSVIASSIAANGVAAGTYGGPTTLAQFTVGVDGRITSATSIAPPGVSTFTAYTNIDNAWSFAQTFLSSVTIKSNFQAINIAGAGANITSLTPGNFSAGALPTNVTMSTANVSPGFNGASEFVQMTAGGIYPAASGANITALTAANISAGSLGASVIASSIAVRAVGANQLATGAVSTNTWTGTAQVTQGGTGSTTASGARTNLSAAQSGTNADITNFSNSITFGTTVTVVGNNLSVGGSLLTVSTMGVTSVVTTSTQAVFSGYSPTAGASHFNGAIAIGDSDAARGIFQYDGSTLGALYLDNTYNNVGAITKIRMRTSGTAIDAITILGSGGVTVPNFSSATTNGYTWLGPWYSFTPTWTGFSADPSGSNTYRYTIIGKTAHLTVFDQIGAGTSNSTVMTLTLPAVLTPISQHTFTGSGTDNGVSLATPCEVYFNGTTTVNMYKDFAGTAWTPTGGKFCSFDVTYEIQ